MGNIVLYEHGANLYVNITNRCPCSCLFCLRDKGNGINEDESLWLLYEPSIDEIKKAVSEVELNKYNEVVFCGYGEPTERLDVLCEVSKYIKEISDITIRLNTNGLSDLINQKKTASLIVPYIDIISISLNAPTKEEYNEICRPVFKEKAFDAVLDFAIDCKKHIDKVFFTIVDVLDEAKTKECKKLCDDLGIELRIRTKI